MNENIALVDTVRIAEMIGISVAAAQRLARNGTIPSFHAGRLWRFNPEEVLAAMKNGHNEEGQNER